MVNTISTSDWRQLVTAFIVAVAMLGGAEPAAAANACTRLAVSALKQYSPSGYDTYQKLQDKSVFDSFASSCDDKKQFFTSDVQTAVHESVHALRAERNAYHLVNNEMLPVPPAPNYFEPAQLVPALAKHPKIKQDLFFETYLSTTGEHANSSRTDFTYLLDELNAYTNDFQVQIDFSRRHPMTNRDGGVPALMTFVAAYASHARDRAPGTWADLTANPPSPTRRAVITLWSQAERVLQRACEVAPTSPNEMSAYVGYLCGASSAGAISIVLGRQAQCPKACAADLKGPHHPGAPSEAELESSTPAGRGYSSPTQTGAFR